MTDVRQRDAKESPVKAALREIRRLKEELASERRRWAEPVAIVGIGLRLPAEVDTPAAYWDLLANGVEAVGPIPRDRWPHESLYHEDADAPGKYYVQRGGFLSAVDGFDPEFFGIAPVEALTMDPQQRLLLETAWEALEHGGIPATSLRGSRSGVFVGIGGADYHRLVLSDEAPDTYASTGTLLSVAAGRLSYVLGLNGPAMAVDTACSSSLVAVHLACRSLRSGESDLALAAGVNLMLAPDLTVNFCRAGMLSRDGRCKTFDAEADGYVRSEGCGVVVLKRLSDALQAGDRIHAVIRGSAINQDGRSSGLTAPSGPAQEGVLRDALRDAGLEANDIGYLEAHGTGTSLGDPIEVQAIGSVFGPGRPADRPLLIGSVKTNLGHLEAAAGIAGLIKVALSLEHGEIPPHLHFRTPNPHISWAALPIGVPVRRTPWERINGKRRAGVSSFGFSGTNAHVILEEAPPSEAPAPITPRPAELLVLSAPHPDGLRAAAARFAGHLRRAKDPFADVCYTSVAGRVHFAERLAILAPDADAARRALEEWLEGSMPAGVRTGRVSENERSALAFAFTGHDAPGRTEVQALARNSATFRQALEACDTALRPHLDVSLQDLLADSDANADLLRRPLYAQPALFATQYALASLWRALGAQPALVLGEGVGEYVAAHLAGAFSLEDALRLVVARARCVESGATQAGAQPVGAPAVSATSELEAALHAVELRPADGMRFISGLTGAIVSPQATAQPGYWLRQVREPGRFRDALCAAREDGVRHGIRIGTRSGADAKESPSDEAIWMSGGLGGADPWRTVLDSLSLLYTQGLSPDPRGLSYGRAMLRVPLPTYPFQRRRFWFQPTRLKSVAATPAARPASRSTERSSWDDCVSAASERAQLVPMGMDMGTYAESWTALNELTEVLWRNALAELGAFAQEGVEHDLAAVLDATGIRPIYARVAERWLDALVRAGVLERTAAGYRAHAPLAALDAGPAWERVEVSLAGDLPLLNYLRHSAGLLPDVLAGRTSSLETLFPGGSFDLAADLYHKSTLLRYVNGIGASALAAYVASLPADANVRVLEIGAGTGGTTAPLAKVLPASRTEYLYTDVSDIFLEYAGQRFAEFPFLRTARFDLEKDPEPQGVEPGTWNVVVAANVVHATRDVRTAVQRLRSLLAPGGLLLLVESTGHHPWHDISTGLIEGWQHFEDDLRTDTPLLPPEAWTTLLRDAGFVEAVALPDQGSAANVLKQHVLLACAPGRASGAAAAATAEEPAAAADSPSETVPSLLKDLLQAPSSEREERLTAVVRDCVITVLRSDPERPPARNARLLDLGLDSLMAVRLRNLLQERLGLDDSLPSTLVFDYPTIRQIAQLLVGLLDGDESRSTPTVTGSARAEETDAVQVAALSDAQVESMLLDRLESEELQ